jgi:hypothetical protein|tara:strand:+ start:3287 stop:4504 length:1218 start_codon:yes stop_codon:yes gene_type:complete
MTTLRDMTVQGFADGPNFDAFSRFRTSNPHTTFDSKLLVGKGAQVWDEVTAGGATSTHSSTDAAVSLAVSANNDYVIRQTFMRFDYQPGKSQLIFLTGVLGEPVANTSAKFGYFNSSTSAPYTADIDGIYFGSDGTDVYLAISKNGTETAFTQDQWDDPMDGTGASGLTADWDSTQIFVIDFHLAVGRVRYYLDIGGGLCLVHEIKNANAGQTGAYMSSPNHSVRYEVRSTGGTLTAKQICCSIQSEGGKEPSGVSRGFNTGVTTQTLGTSLEAMIGYRLKSTHLDATVINELISLMATGNEDTRWELQMNPTYSDSPSWTSAGTTSPVEYAVGSGANAVSADGERLAIGYASDNINDVNLDIKTVIHPGVAIDGTRDEIWLCASTVTGTGNYVAGVNVRELIIG